MQEEKGRGPAPENSQFKQPAGRDKDFGVKDDLITEYLFAPTVADQKSVSINLQVQKFCSEPQNDSVPKALKACKF